MITEALIRFMQRLVKDAGRKVALVLDTLKAHHSKVVKQWLEFNQDSNQAAKYRAPQKNLWVSSGSGSAPRV